MIDPEIRNARRSSEDGVDEAGPETGPDPDRPDPSEPDPSKGAGRKGNVQRKPEDQRGRPDPKRRN